MNEEYIDNVKHLIEQKMPIRLKNSVDLHPADIAELCKTWTRKKPGLSPPANNETAADVLVEMDEDVRKEFLEMIPSKQSPNARDYMDTDDARRPDAVASAKTNRKKFFRTSKTSNRQETSWTSWNMTKTPPVVWSAPKMAGSRERTWYAR